MNVCVCGELQLWLQWHSISQSAFWMYLCACCSADQLCVLMHMLQCWPNVCTHAHVAVLTNCVYSCTCCSADQLCVLTRIFQCWPTVCTHAHVAVLTNCVYLRASFSADQLRVSVINLIQIDHKHPISSIVHCSFGHDELSPGRAQLVTGCLPPLPVSRLLVVVAA